MTCKECIHYDVCNFHIDEETKMTVNECNYGFKDKSRFVELPEGAIILTKAEIEALNKYESKLRGEASE